MDVLRQAKPQDRSDGTAERDLSRVHCLSIGRFPQILLVALIALLLVSCTSGRNWAPVRESTEKSAGKPEYHVVQRGDTLYAVAWRYGYDYHQMAEWNGIKPPYVIYPGQRLRLGPGSRATPSPSTRTARIGTNERRSGEAVKEALPRKDGAGNGGTSRQMANLPAVSKDGLTWQWPVEGNVIREFDSDQPGMKGLAITGYLGQSVRAAAPGKVVYSGSGLIGYGQLVIVKHDDIYLSAYGFNRKLLVKEEDEVSGGQVIAEMGVHGLEGPMLHFEIRSNGKPVDPLRFLPRR